MKRVVVHDEDEEEVGESLVAGHLGEGLLQLLGDGLELLLLAHQLVLQAVDLGQLSLYRRSQGAGGGNAVD